VNAVNAARAALGVRQACDALGLARSAWYRSQTPVLPKPPGSDEQTRPCTNAPRALHTAERQLVLDQLNSERFADMAVPQVHAVLLDEGCYLCSQRTMYRILDGAKQLRERRDQLRHPVYSKPELLASAPNQLWSWDITKLKGRAKWNHYHLYVILDVYSRYVVGWMVAERESAALARELIDQTIAKQGIQAGQLTLHADRGSSMKSKDVALLLADLGVTKTHSRPHVSNDNPYSEAGFKTLKYCPEFPERFGSIEHARDFCRSFFDWYNHEHRHSGIAMMRPSDVHTGRVEAIVEQRAAVMEAACRQHPERFVRGAPAQQRRPQPAWINPPLVTVSAAANTAH
jgi:putative transposase